jgi:multimeric flavodoxin WrbA
MLKCLVIHGSARKGNTYKAVNLVMNELQKQGNCVFNEIFIRDLKLPFCNSCFACINRDEKLCPHSETVGKIDQLMQECDAVIIGCPIYIMHINAETKNLLDHFAYRFHRPMFFRKKALVITTTAGAGAKIGTKFLKESLYQMGYNYAWEIPITCWNIDFIPKQKDLHRISELAGKFYKDVISGRMHRPTWSRIAFHSVFRAAAWSGRNKQTADYIYWHEKGLLEMAHPIKLGIVKTLVANTIYTIVRKFIPV